ncbi:MAG: type II methionyl aminopeptidase [Candidatus Hydrothermarchaeaceae archaeon]
MADIAKHTRAGIIAAKVMEKGLKSIEVGAKLLDVAVLVEDTIRREGAHPAFPCNISMNDVAAHYTPQAGDEAAFKKGDMVKLDLGVHVDGYIADIAVTKDLGGNKKLVKASADALGAAIDIIKPGIMTNEIGAVVEDTIKGAGFEPVSNLTGHYLSRWNLHGGVIVPNVRARHGEEIREGDIIALEPFATTGAGRVVDDPEAIIFRYLEDRPIRMREARSLLRHAKENYGNLPFAERWISHLMPKLRLNMALRQLVSTKALYAYRILREKERGLISQAEHTVLVNKGGCEVITGGA